MPTQTRPALRPRPMSGDRNMLFHRSPGRAGSLCTTAASPQARGPSKVRRHRLLPPRVLQALTLRRQECYSQPSPLRAAGPPTGPSPTAHPAAAAELITGSGIKTSSDLGPDQSPSRWQSPDLGDTPGGAVFSGKPLGLCGDALWTAYLGHMSGTGALGL